jgi:hypothetical protein
MHGVDEGTNGDTRATHGMGGEAGAMCGMGRGAGAVHGMVTVSEVHAIEEV